MDPNYVMFLPAGQPPAEPDSPVQRRDEAMRQWVRARADAEYAAAMECVEAAERTHCPVWRQFVCLQRDRVARRVRVAEDECLAEHPLAFNVDRRTVVPPPGDRILAALTRVDENALLREMQPFDPLSWHCGHRTALQAWFCWNGTDSDAANGTPTPQRPRDPPSRPTGDAEHAVVRQPLTVQLDALAWPPVRRVAAKYPAVADAPAAPPPPGPSSRPRTHSGRRVRRRARSPRAPAAGRRLYSPDRTSRSNKRRRSTSDQLL